MPTIAQLNRIITIRRIAIGQNTKGLQVKVVLSNVTTYASAKVISSSYTLEQAQTTYGKLWEFVIRWAPSRIVQDNDQILYNNQTYTINSVVRSEEGGLQWVTIRATLNDHSGETSGGDMIIRATKEIHVIGDVVIGGDDYSNWDGEILAFRDGIFFRVKRDGSAAGKQINYDSSTGLFTYPADLIEPQPGETTDIYFL